MRAHGRAAIQSDRPRALGVCDRCGFLYNHDRLSWQFEWRGTKLQNIRILVCEECYDEPQQQLKTLILPPDPVPILNARPYDYVSADNPMSPLGAGANFLQQTFGSRIGNLTGGGGLNAAFDGSIYKPASMSAINTISNSSYNNYVGINWSGNQSVLNAPSSLQPPVLRHSLRSFTAYAPSDRGFLGSVATSYVVQASPVDIPVYAAWTTISSGTTTGTAAESITADCAGGEYQFHRIAFLGDQLNFVSVAQVEFNVAQIGQPATSGSS